MTEESKQEEVEQNDAPATEEVVKEKIVEKIVEKEVEVNVDYKDQYLRLVAEFDNARKRMERDKQDFVKFANEGIVSELLQVVDHLDLSVQAAKKNPDDIKNLIMGIEMVLNNAQELLKNNGVTPIDVVGQTFDHHLHEILAQEPSDQAEGTILEELQRGYMYHDRVLRTSKVKVAQKEN